MQCIAKITWLKPIEGGRVSKIPFNTIKYAPIIRFNGCIGNWSLIVNNFREISSYVTLAKIQYSNVDKAPDNLVGGLNFELYEGHKKVAVGKILERVEE